MTNIRYLSIDDLPNYRTLLKRGIHEDLDVFAWKLQNDRCLAELNLNDLLSTHSNQSIVIGAFQDSVLIGAVTLIFNQNYSLSHKAVIENMCVMGNNHELKEQIAKQLIVEKATTKALDKNKGINKEISTKKDIGISL